VVVVVLVVLVLVLVEVLVELLVVVPEHEVTATSQSSAPS
jgi:hypothetical protein